MIGITGGKGVLGKILCNFLDQKNIPYSLFEGDVRDSKVLENWFEEKQISQVIFLAAKVAIDEVNRNKEIAYDVNVNGIIQTIKAIKNYQKNIYFFYASTSHVYDSSEKPIDENYTILPQNTYGLTKHMAEKILEDFANNNTNFQLCIGRIFSFYHQSQNPPYLYPTIINRLKEENLALPFKLRGALSVRDFSNAEKIVDIILNICLQKIVGIYNIGSGKGIQIKDFVSKFAPNSLKFEFDENEIKSYLVADISKLKKTLVNYEL